MERGDYLDATIFYSGTFSKQKYTANFPTARVRVNCNLFLFFLASRSRASRVEKMGRLSARSTATRTTGNRNGGKLRPARMIINRDVIRREYRAEREIPGRKTLRRCRRNAAALSLSFSRRNSIRVPFFFPAITLVICNPISQIFLFVLRARAVRIKDVFYSEVNCTRCTYVRAGYRSAFCFIRTTHATFESIVFKRFL